MEDKNILASRYMHVILTARYMRRYSENRQTGTVKKTPAKRKIVLHENNSITNLSERLLHSTTIMKRSTKQFNAQNPD